MKGLYRFSPIKNKDELLDAIEYIHLECFKLCFCDSFALHCLEEKSKNFLCLVFSSCDFNSCFKRNFFSASPLHFSCIPNFHCSWTKFKQMDQDFIFWSFNSSFICSPLFLFKRLFYSLINFSDIIGG